jgi:hypothetical protein
MKSAANKATGPSHLKFMPRALAYFLFR